jgi:hypothetical protein
VTTVPLAITRGSEIRTALGAFAALCEGRDAVYVSSPLTTGKRRARWHAASGLEEPSDSGYLEQLRKHVVEPNRSGAREFVRVLRASSGQVVINPADLPDLEDWTQDDYRYLWGEVIGRFVNTVIFRNGWQYSSGCAYEFLVAVQTGATTLDERMKPLSLDRGRSLVGAVVRAASLRSGTRDEFHARVNEELGRLSGQATTRL